MLRFLMKSRKSLGFGWGSRYFRKNFILILLITFTPGLISGVGIYLFGAGKVENELTNLHENQIEERAKNINDQLDVLEMSIAQWAFAPHFRKTLNKVDFVREFTTTREIKKFLGVLQGSQPLIDQVELFVDQETPILFQPNYTTVKDDSVKNFYRDILAKTNSINWVEQGPSDKKGHSSMMLTHNLGFRTNSAYGTLIVTLDQAKLTEIVNTLNPYPEGAAFLLNQNNEILVEENHTNSLSIVSVLKRELDKREKRNETFTFEYEGERYSVSYGTQKRINSEWTYVSAAPMSFITAPIIFISKLIIAISATGLFIAFIMAWFASKRIYRPVAQLLHLIDKEDEVLEWRRQKGKDEFSIIEQQIQALAKDSRILQEQLSAQIPQLLKRFLSQLIQGYLFNHSENQLRGSLQNYGWNVDGHFFMMMDVRVTGNVELDESSQHNDERLIAMAVTNVLEEAAGERFAQYNLMDFHDLSVGMLIAYPSHEDVRQDVFEFIDQITEMINTTFNKQVTVTISKPTDSIKQIPHIFEEVKQGAGYRTYKSHNQVIDLAALKKEDAVHQIFYPFDIEKEIIQAIRMGQLEEAERLLFEFLHKLSEKGINEINIQPGIVLLFSSIQHEIIHSGIHPYELFKGRNMFEELSQIQEPKMIVRWFKTKIIVPFIEMLEERSDSELKQIVDQVIKDIHMNYMKDLSLESYADQVGTNPYTFSRYFKKAIGTNFIDYITQLRIDKAKDLLLNTDMKINDISESVGYRPGYFNRIFKKQVGIPPSQYRKSRAAL
ncbi:AraC-like DNA-binding protein [Neobacillus niacini]|uniref:AraC family transcriptional regulator n=1 Tax=Neobacillus driksii TaxID=3035913 RepID=UPI0027819C24|nr:AraC family transcriptional regulator [Neobacillus niacini]MDQ0974729.1 AraC-like DNA-binding protein [Neobacillus niacini]